jgi:hypothetical protein
MSPSKQYVVEENLFGRKIIVNATMRSWAWSGMRWVPHSKGVPMSILQAQISNFSNEAEADECAQKAGLEKQPQ